MFICKACRQSILSTALLNRQAALTRANSISPSVLSLRVANHAARRGFATPAATAATAAATSHHSIQEAPSGQHGVSDASLTHKQLRWRVRKHLEHTKDPFTVARQVQHILTHDSDDAFNEALLLTQTAGKDMQCVVSWNHLLDYQFRRQKLRPALRLFNEMKKRAQLPDAQTYTIIFRGCAQSHHHGVALLEALKIYQNMFNSERMKPNTHHMNAMLEVCARANDIESMASILKSANTALRAPNNFTYTTILNALRNQFDRTVQNIADLKVQTAKLQTIERATVIWEDVVSSWRKGRLVMDEPLACAMGRSLLMGNQRDHGDSILRLVEQTMNIPIPDSKGALSGSPESKADATKAAQVDGDPTPAPETVRPRAPKPSQAPTLYAKPGPNTLSLILSAVRLNRRTTLADRYWKLLTETHGVVPDDENYHQLLRTLRAGRSSTRAVEVVGAMPPAYTQPKTFRIALAACALDGLNQHAFANARALLALMQQRLHIPDVHALRTFLRVAYRALPRDQEPAESRVQPPREGDLQGDEAPGRRRRDRAPPPPPPMTPMARFALGTQLLRALDDLEPLFRVARNALAYPAPGGRPRTSGQAVNDEAELVALARRMVAAYDKLITEGLVGPEYMRRLKTSRSLMNAYVLRFFGRRGEPAVGSPAGWRSLKVGSASDSPSAAGARAQKPWGDEDDELDVD